MLRRKNKNLYCCEKCQNYWTCETKWYRGEKGQESICCKLCSFYETHWKDVSIKKLTSQKSLGQALKKKLNRKKK